MSMWCQTHYDVTDKNSNILLIKTVTLVVKVSTYMLPLVSQLILSDSLQLILAIMSVSTFVTAIILDLIFPIEHKKIEGSIFHSIACSAISHHKSKHYALIILTVLPYNKRVIEQILMNIAPIRIQLLLTSLYNILFYLRHNLIILMQ